MARDRKFRFENYFSQSTPGTTAFCIPDGDRFTNFLEKNLSSNFRLRSMMRKDRSDNRQRTMKAREPMHEVLDVHAEVYHRHKIDALRAEGERLRHELRRRGVDPTHVLSEVHQSRTGRASRQN
jgi:hypothetical protein